MWRRWLRNIAIFVVTAVILFVPIMLTVFYHLNEMKGDLIALDANALRKAVNGYANRRNGQFPAQLMDLVEPPDGSSPMIGGGANALLDGWGQPYKYAVQPDETGKPTAYVWAERTVYGTTKVYGTKPPGLK